ncbi:MAG TPA: hypothetical protein VFQ58_00365 [Flavisolibacter sp.]|nr:hypothetical protein [Flavisolibacter sp.]
MKREEWKIKSVGAQQRYNKKSRFLPKRLQFFARVPYDYSRRRLVFLDKLDVGFSGIGVIYSILLIRFHNKYAIGYSTFKIHSIRVNNYPMNVNRYRIV